MRRRWLRLLCVQAEADVGVHVGGGMDLGVAEEVFDGDQVHALFQEQSGAGVPQVVEPDVAHFGNLAQDLVVTVHSGRV